MWYTHTVEYYSASKRKEIPTHAATQMNLEELRSHTHKNLRLCEVPRLVKCTERERRMVVARAGGRAVYGCILTIIV